MPARHGLAAVTAALVATASCTALPVIALSGIAQPDTCSTQPADGTPTILGPATLTVDQLEAWWLDSGHPEPARLGISARDLAALYLSEAGAEGIRGDLALAQAIVETGWFTNSDTTRNNFAGIAHYDTATAGRTFPTVAIGIRAHVQLLHKYSAGNDTPLAYPDVAPRAGAHADTWGQLAGTWATDPNYWTAINNVHQSMLDTATAATPDRTTTPPPVCPSSATRSYTLPVDWHWYDQHPDWFTKPHHDYPAADIPVPLGTPIYAITAGTVTATPDTGRCGTGVTIDGNDGAQYTYCHGAPGTRTITPGDHVETGQHLMDSASTGNSTGPHLHLGIRINGQARCPQPLLAAIANSADTNPETLPTDGCIG